MDPMFGKLKGIASLLLYLVFLNMNNGSWWTYIATSSVCSFFCDSAKQSCHFLPSPLWGLEYSPLMAFMIILNSHNALVSIWTSRFYLYNNTLTGYRYHWSTSSQTFLSRNLLYPNGFFKKLRDRCSMRLLLWPLQNHAIRNLRVGFVINVETKGENVCNEKRLTVPLCFIK